MAKSKSFPSIDPSTQEAVQQATSRILPRSVSTGQYSGVQGVGEYGIRIDNPNRRIYVITTDGDLVGLGVIPGSDPEEYGFFQIDADDNLIKKTVAGIDYYYDTSGNLMLKIDAGATYYYDTSGNLLQKIEGGTNYFYDASGNNKMQLGILPNSVHGFAIAKAGYEVDDAITA